MLRSEEFSLSELCFMLLALLEQVSDDDRKGIISFCVDSIAHTSGWQAGAHRAKAATDRQYTIHFLVTHSSTLSPSTTKFLSMCLNCNAVVGIQCSLFVIFSLLSVRIMGSVESRIINTFKSGLINCRRLASEDVEKRQGI